MTERPAAPRSADGSRVSDRELIAYGMGGFPMHFAGVSVKSLAIPIYQMSMRVDPVLLGVAMALPRIWDAFIDPWIGYRSDQTRSRWGRRRPYLVIGAILGGIAFAAIWFVPEDWPPTAKGIWFLCTSLVFYTVTSLWSVPYQSLGYEISPDYHERTRIMGIQTLMTRICDFGYQWMFPLAQLPWFASTAQGVHVVTAVAGIVIFGGMGLVPALLVRERFVAPSASQVGRKVSFIESFRAVLANRGMLVLSGLTMLKLIANMFASSLDYYLIVYAQCGGDIAEGSFWKGLLSSAYAIVGVLAIVPVAWLSRRLDKRRALAVIYLLAVLGGVVKWLVFRPGNLWWILLDPLFNAPVWIGLYMLVPSMIADLCDEDELRTGLRREGIYGAFFNWCVKLGASLAVLGGGLTVKWVGFDANLGSQQLPSALLGMRLILALATTISALLALVLLMYYPLGEKRARAIRVELEARRGAAA